MQRRPQFWKSADSFSDDGEFGLGGVLPCFAHLVVVSSVFKASATGPSAGGVPLSSVGLGREIAVPYS